MGSPMSEKQVKESQSHVAPPSLHPGGGRGVTIKCYQSLGLGSSRKNLLGLKCTYIVLCWPNADVLILYIV